ncbi:MULTISPECIES: hypothetical protein [Pseudomonas]|uniref:hypothetical protein n=1 Tax=Pseudomonas TaxID=286 RepID=UPI0011A1EF57|nr:MULTISPECIES: hypothetical protein [Pseudomonas]MBI6923881.1 hypothetical protein [Pseudomonas putida]
MRDDDLHEPEHDHLLDHEFLHDEQDAFEPDAHGAQDEVEVLPFDELEENERNHPAWFDDCEDE